MHERIKTERERLGYSQEELAKKLGTTRVTQGKYETGKTQPTTKYLLALQDIGADIYYIFTGNPSSNSLSIEEQLLLKKFREFDKLQQGMLLNMFINGKENEQKEAVQTTTINFGGIGNQTAGRDINNGR